MYNIIYDYPKNINYVFDNADRIRFGFPRYGGFGFRPFGFPRFGFPFLLGAAASPFLFGYPYYPYPYYY